MKYKGYIKVGLLRIDVDQGYMLPSGYGLAYTRYDAPINVCYPLGINWIVWLLRECYFRLAYTPRNTTGSMHYQIGYRDGMENGKQLRSDEIKYELLELKDKIKTEVFKEIVDTISNL